MSAEKFPTLKEMGIEDPYDIQRYSSRIENDIDVLKIYLHRHQGEWMAKSKKFKFKRAHKAVPTDSGFVPFRDTTEASPYFLKAVAELDQLVAGEKQAKDKKEHLIEELDHLEKVVTRKVDELRRRIDEL
ncbi:DUF3461 family protein [Aliamphritea hakodatensis]|uniref:DUF3461 family protein n=1 Tax=Aliamphritea hakodatensis TaxID=2895352 RepID=UPI0022FD7E6B|nr:DUF3461 family protein [Aliamphritea hakodatensis]